jgi:flagellar motor component MotA
MSKSDIHAKSSAKKFGGKATDYIEIHEMIDSSKAFCADNRHRFLFHHSAGTFYIQKMFGVDFDEIEKIKSKYNLPNEFIEDLLNLFKNNRSKGVHILNSDNKKIHVRDIAEQHILEDFRDKFIPTINDYINNMQLKNWMNNALSPIIKEKVEGDHKEFKSVINID